MKNLAIFTVFVAFYGCLAEDGSSTTPEFSTSVLSNTTTTTTKIVPPSSTSTTTHSTPSTTPLSPTDIPKDPTTNKFNVSKNGQICILFSAAIRMSFLLEIANGKNETKMTEVPSTASASGSSCDITDNSQFLNLTFFNESGNHWNLTITFKRNTTEKEFSMTKINLQYVIRSNQYPFPEATKTVNGSVDIVINDEWCWDAKSYVCVSKRELKIGNGTSLGLVGMDIYNEQYSAFLNTTNPDFPTEGERCSDDSVSNLIPIIVGACLGGLIIIVLIAYLIGRRRSKRGYESV